MRRCIVARGRDLAQNWNIDVASELEDYMDELEDIKISFDGGETELNFAEGTGAPRRLPSGNMGASA